MSYSTPFLHEIIPSPGTEMKEWKGIEERLKTATTFSKTVHIDIIDGKFANNKTFLDPQPFATFTKDTLFEVHLMVEDPITYIDGFAKAGFRRFIGHIEKMPNQDAFVAKAQTFGEVGLALDGKTPIEALHVPLVDLDMLLVMTINAGFSGQKLMPETLEKVKKLSETQLVPIEVDGGINRETISEALLAGATRFVATSALFSVEKPESAYQQLTEMVSRH